jgi:pimeloyl-ACP methyl ester carboxylesterase
MCGTLPVPFDRDHPQKGIISIYFELYLHTGSDSAESAILVSFGGPGVTTTGLRNVIYSLLTPDLDKHDLLLTDDRGRGQSQAIDCPELQHGTASFPKAEADCAAQLGNGASRYGTGDIANDTEAVRAALGYDKVDYYGFSYGGADAIAYATRFGEHVRSLVLDSPFGPAALPPFRLDHFRTRAMPRKIRLGCLRSPTCAPDHPDPVATLDALVDQIGSHPISGDAYDVFGQVHHVRMDEEALLNFVVAQDLGAVLNTFSNTGEILAAAKASFEGDQAPLLRAGAEGFFTLIADFGDPTGFSLGASQATFCSDAFEPWNWTLPV